MSGFFVDEDGAYDYEDYWKRRLRERCRDQGVFDKNVAMKTFLHYSDPTAHQERTVFGEKCDGLFYNYSDRLQGKKWREGWDKAKAAGAVEKSARFYEIVLNHFHDTDDVDLQHVILGCNMATGYDYLVFGYTYTEKCLTEKKETV